MVFNIVMKILMHICCANCAIYPVKTLREEGHSVTGFWFNPNIHPSQEHKLRLDSLRNFAAKYNIDVIYDEYEPVEFLKMFNPTVMDLHNINIDKIEIPPDFIPQHPERCKSCYSLRLEKTAQKAAKYGFNAFSTTLLISPYQDFEGITTISKAFADKYNVAFYLKDFRPDFRKAMTISKELSLYRQKYCGCIYSRAERSNQIKNKK